MANHKKTETAAKLKKFYANLSNAIKLAETEWGIDTFDFQTGCGYTSNKDSFEKYLAKHISYVKTEKLQSGNDYFNALADGMYSEFSSYNQELFTVYLNDGSLYFNDECFDLIVYDVNGEKGPNQYGRDLFYFFILIGADNEDLVRITTPHVNTSWSTITLNSDGTNYYSYTREEKKERCKNKETGDGCSALLEADGWEFKNDYPFRL